MLERGVKVTLRETVQPLSNTKTHPTQIDKDRNPDMPRSSLHLMKKYVNN
jgi:hypothetical protein